MNVSLSVYILYMSRWVQCVQTHSENSPASLFLDHISEGVQREHVRPPRPPPPRPVGMIVFLYKVRKLSGL